MAAESQTNKENADASNRGLNQANADLDKKRIEAEAAQKSITGLRQEINTAKENVKKIQLKKDQIAQELIEAQTNSQEELLQKTEQFNNAERRVQDLEKKLKKITEESTRLSQVLKVKADELTQKTKGIDIAEKNADRLQNQLTDTKEKLLALEAQSQQDKDELNGLKKNH